MFVHDRQFFIVDPARSLYNVTAMYASNMVANSALTVLNAGVFMLLMYALIGARPLPLGLTLCALELCWAPSMFLCALVAPAGDVGFVCLPLAEHEHANRNCMFNAGLNA